MGAARNELLRCAGSRFPAKGVGLFYGGLREIDLARREVASFSQERIAHFGMRAV